MVQNYDFIGLFNIISRIEIRLIAMKKINVVLICSITTFLIYGCHSSRQKPPDVSHIQIPPVHVQRFDREFMQIDSNHVLEGLAQMKEKYPVFIPVYLVNIMNFGPFSDTSNILKTEVRSFITAVDVRRLQDTIDRHFPSMTQYEKELQQGFRYIKYYFPAFKPPKILAFESGLANYGAITADSILGIGLDMFLGPDFIPYTKVSNPYPDYMLRQFSAEFIPADCFKVLEQQMFPLSQRGTLLDQMVAFGKQLYFLDKVMPDAPDSIKIGFTQFQLNWCKKNEQFIWQYFVQNNILYTHDMQEILHYIGPGPNTRGMPSVSPGNIGSWVGWQIIRKYMNGHPGTTLAQLMHLDNSQQILSEAHYNPH